MSSCCSRTFMSSCCSRILTQICPHVCCPRVFMSSCCPRDIMSSCCLRVFMNSCCPRVFMSSCCPRVLTQIQTVLSVRNMWISVYNNSNTSWYTGSFLEHSLWFEPGSRSSFCAVFSWIELNWKRITDFAI